MRVRPRCLMVAAGLALTGCDRADRGDSGTGEPVPAVGENSGTTPDLEDGRNAGSQPLVAGWEPGGKTADGLGVLPGLADRKFDAVIEDIVAREDPVVDGWDSERFNELADHQLKAIGELIVSGAVSAAELDGIAAADAEAGDVRPTALELVYDDDRFRVWRPSGRGGDRNGEGENVSGGGGGGGAPQRGVAGMADRLGVLAEKFAGASDGRFKFKTIEVVLDGDVATTRSYFQVSGGTAGGVLQCNAMWECHWRRTGGDGSYPLLERLEVTGYEEVAAATQGGGTGGRFFVDRTGAALAGTSDDLAEQLAYGRDHWYANLEAALGIEGRGNGIAVGDLNGDGLDDLYLCQPSALPNRLLFRNTDGTMRDVSAATGTDWLDSSRCALIVDLDNDGDQDLAVVTGSEIILHENSGGGEFAPAKKIASGSQQFSANAVDYDGDGDLDLYVCGYSAGSRTRPEDIFASPMPYHDANNGAPNSLFRNDGGFAFTDVTSEVGLDANNLRFSLASAWDDYDGDGDQDLYVANDFGRNNLYRNDGGTFTDVAATAGVEDIGPGMSASWGDYNNDGYPDLYVSNMFSSAGSRITRDDKFKPGVADEDLAGFQRHARGNSLFENLRDGTFADRSVASGTVMGRWAWGSRFADINHDGRQDIYVTNGFVTADKPDDDL